METLVLQRTHEIIRERDFLENKLKVKIKVIGKKVIIEGEALDEYEATLVLEAIGFGFPARTAILAAEEDHQFKIVKIKDVTRRKNLEQVRSRIIGKEGKTKRTMENISNCEIIIRDNEIGLIGNVADIEYATTGIQNLVRGSKQSNVYSYLEKKGDRKRK